MDRFVRVISFPSAYLKCFQVSALSWFSVLGSQFDRFIFYFADRGWKDIFHGGHLNSLNISFELYLYQYNLTYLLNNFVQGPGIQDCDEHKKGLLPRVVDGMFEQIRSSKDIARYTVKLSMVLI